VKITKSNYSNNKIIFSKTVYEGGVFCGATAPVGEPNENGDYLNFQMVILTEKIKEYYKTDAAYKGVIVHEFGHCFGLADIPLVTTTIQATIMRAETDMDVMNSLQPFDIRNVQALDY